MKETGTKVKATAKDVMRFAKTKLFIKHFVYALSGSLVLIFGTLFFLDIYTHHGEANSVPNFTGLTLEEAISRAEDKDLSIQVIDSVYNAPGRKGTVVDQTPPPDFKVKENRTIFITMKTFNPEQIPMPNFKGVSILQARADLETYGFKLGKLSYRPDIATNNVLEQMYKGKPVLPGTLVEKGEKIDFILGKSEDGEVNTVVPPLIGLNKSDAEMALMDSYLNSGICTYDQTVRTEADSAKALVWKHSPDVNVSILMGGTVNIWLTLDKSKVSQDDNE